MTYKGFYGDIVKLVYANGVTHSPPAYNIKVMHNELEYWSDLYKMWVKLDRNYVLLFNVTYGTLFSITFKEFNRNYRPI